MRPIDADKVMEEIARIGGHNLCEWETIGVKALIDRQPTIDAVEVRHGEWKMTDFDCAEMSCSICGFTYYGEYDKECMSKYCPECGAKMDG